MANGETCIVSVYNNESVQKVFWQSLQVTNCRYTAGLNRNG